MHNSFYGELKAEWNVGYNYIYLYDGEEAKEWTVKAKFGDKTEIRKYSSRNAAMNWIRRNKAKLQS